MALGLAALPAAAPALDVSLQLIPSYTFTSDRSEGTVTSSTETSQLSQRYRLAVSHEFLPRLRLDTSGFLNWDQSWRREEATWTESERKVWNGDARLSLGSDPLTGQLYYSYQQGTAEQTAAGERLLSPDQIQEGIGFSGSWAPAGLPRLTLLLSRTHSYDSPRQNKDSFSDVLLASAAYTVGPVAMRYSLNRTGDDNRLAGARSETTSQTGQVSWGEAFLERRLALAASYTLATSRTRVFASGPAGVPLQQLPQSGLSIVEPATTTAQMVKLAPSPELVDGNLSAGTGMDLGWGPSASGDTRPRDLGASFADALTQVDLVYLWVDRRLPADVAAALAWSAYRSDDGENWTAVAIAGPVHFGTFDSRFEIQVAGAPAPYFKVVARPLAVGVTTDAQFQHVLATEIQLFRIISPQGQGGGGLSALSGTGTAAARLLLARALNLAYDLSANVAHASSSGSPDRLTWNIANALSLARQLNRILAARARLDHTLGSTRLASGEALQSDLRLTGGLDAAWLPTLRSSLTYQGQAAFASSTLARSYNALLVNTSAEPYRGINASADASYTRGHEARTGSEFSTLAGNASANVQPNPVVTLSGTFSYSGTRSWQGSTTPKETTAGLVTGSLLLAPFPALYGSASITRYIWFDPPTTTVNLAGTFSPLQGGQLLLSFTYNENMDLTNKVRSRIWGPLARWALRPGIHLNLSYTQGRNSFASYRTSSDTAFAQLFIAL